MSALTLLAFQNASILRAFRTDSRNGGQVIHVLKDLGEKLERDPSNVRKSLKALAEADLLAIDADNPVVARLTDAGEAALSALDRAEGGEAATPPAGYIALRYDQIGEDPDNARKTSGLSDEAIADMADSLLDKGFLQAPAVRPNPAFGQGDGQPEYLLTMGERRRRGWGLNIERGVWDADKLVLCRQDIQVDDAARVEASLVENLHRSDLSNLEMAEGFLVLHERYGRTPRQIQETVAKQQTLRFVQIALKVAKGASDEDKARYAASHEAAMAAKARGEPMKPEFTWEQLRDTVRTAKYVTEMEKRQRVTMLVAELAWKIQKDPEPLLVGEPDAEVAFTQINTPPGGGYWGTAQDLGLVLDHRQEGLIYGAVTAQATEYLKDAGFHDNPQRWVEDIRVDVLGAMGIQLLGDRKAWATDFLNPPAPKPPEPPPKPVNPDEATDETITPYQALLLGELVHKLRYNATPVKGDADIALLASGYRFNRVEYQALLWGGYIAHGSLAHLNRDFLRATFIAERYLDKVELNPLRDPRKLADLRRAAGMQPGPGHMYAIPFLNETLGDEANAVREPEPSPATPPRDTFAEQIRQVNADPAPPAAPVRDETQLEPDLFMVLAEVAHKITTQGVETRGGAIRGCHVHAYHTGPHAKAAQALLHKRYLMFVQAPNSHGFLATLTQAGWDYFGCAIDDEVLEGFRQDNLSTDDLLAFEASGQRYATTWLQDPVKVSEPKAIAPAVDPELDPELGGAPLAEDEADGDDDLGSPFSEDDDSSRAELTPEEVTHYVGQCRLYLLVFARPMDAIHSQAAFGTREEADEIIALLKASGQYDTIDLYTTGGARELVSTWSAR